MSTETSKHFSDNSSDDQSWLKKIENLIEEENKTQEEQQFTKSSPLKQKEWDKIPPKTAKEILDHLEAQNKSVNELEEVEAEFLKDITELKPENKMWILQSLGFKQEGKGVWSYPLFKSYMLFDIATDDPRIIINRVYNVGWRDAKTDIW